MNTQRGGDKGTSVGRNESREAGTGTVRDPQGPEESESEHETGSGRLDIESHHEGETGENIGRGQGGIRVNQ
jgi:hypothetical protein